MGRKGNFPLQELPLHILELLRRAEIEVRISVCNFPSSTPPLPVSQAPPQHLLWVSPSRGSQSESQFSDLCLCESRRRAGGHAQQSRV